MNTATYPNWLLRELRSDHAGEAGAVAIYRGILAVSRCPQVREFARRHMQTEQRHLATVETLVPQPNRSRLLAIWKAAGFVTGALPSLVGRNAVYSTIEAVETFVDMHYAEQIERLESSESWSELQATLKQCWADELEHRDEARDRRTSSGGFVMRIWLKSIAIGSQVGVAIARRV